MFLTKKIRRIIGASAFGITLMTGQANAQSGKEINVTTITTWPPYESKDLATNKLIGFDIDIMEAIAAKMGMKVNWTETSFDQLISWNSIKTKRVDAAISGLADLPSYHGSVDMIDYLYDNEVFYTLKENASRFPTMDALCGKTVAVTRSSTVYNTGVKAWSDEHCVKAGKSPINVIGTDNAAQSRLQLNQGRADATVAGEATLNYQNSIEGNRYMVLGQPFTKILNGIAYAKDNSQLGEALKKGLSGIIADGTYGKIHAKWKLPAATAVDKPLVSTP